jgi:phosphate transport system protein
MQVEPGHARHFFTEQLRALEHEMLEMGSIAENMVGDAVESLRHLDTDLARSVMKRDDEIDKRDLSIETRCLRLLALQQPAGADLRTVGTIMKMITDLERVGDLAVDIARITLKIEKEFGEPNFIDLLRMVNEARQMLRASLDAFVRCDLDLVREVTMRDEVVDQLYRENREQIFNNMREHPENVVTDGWLLLAVHHVERIADHAVNIAERVNFVATGEMKKLTEKEA